MIVEFKIVTKNGIEYNVIGLKDRNDSKILKIFEGDALIIPDAEILDLSLSKLRSYILQPAL